MKPCRIEMQAFGPYVFDTAVDFKGLYESGIFLITGATGCGKTTILDAMSFALYGRATGCVRDARDMRSTAAPDSLETHVIFEFELGGLFYKFERGIRIRELKKRSGVLEIETAYFESCYGLVDEQWRLICSGSQVKEKAEELLGFSYEQFSQVVVLPQGEFRKLLTASSSDKQKILEALFRTSRWQSFTKRLSDSSKELEAQLSKCKEKKVTLLKSVGCERLEVLCERLVKSRQDCENILNQINELNGAYTKALNDYSSACELDGKFAELNNSLKRLNELSARAAEIDKMKSSIERSQKAEKLLPYAKALEQANKSAESARETKQNCTREFEAAKNLAQVAQKELEACEHCDELLLELSAKKTRLESVLEPSKSLGGANAELSKKQVEHETFKKDAVKSSGELESIAKEIETVEIKIKENFEKNISRLPEFKAVKDKLEAQSLGFKNYHDQEAEVKRLELCLDKKRNEFNSAKQTLKNEKLALENLQKNFEHDAAFRLAQGLQESVPCPVCGSISHPKPASTMQGAPSKEEIETKKNVVSGLEETLSQIREDGAKLKGKVEAAQKRLMELGAECEKYECTEADIVLKLTQAKKELEAAQNAANLQKPMEEKKNLLQFSLDSAKKRTEAAKLASDKAAVEVSKLEGRVEELAAAVPIELRDAGAVSASIEAIQKEYDRTAEKVKSARDQDEKARISLTAARERLGSADENLHTENKKLEAASTECEEKFAQSGLPKETDVYGIVLTQSRQDELTETIKEYEREKTLEKDKAERLKEQIKDLPRPDLAALKNLAEEIHEAEQKAATKKGSLETEIKVIEKTKSELLETQELEEKVHGDYSLYNQIFTMCNGNNPLKTPIHQFVLGLMLDDIVSCANMHLSQFSRGQYTLVRSSELMRGGGSKGLDLSVEDAWIGGQRSVNTLSGGEMFLASLSLAFGLSDVVQSYAGGIRLDSLFIDEGFGSLDTETLEIAMGALERLRLSGRLIGVISHVNELRSRIPAHIEVSRRADGSATATVIAP